MTSPIPPTSLRWFFGRISRDEAEIVLNGRGCKEGLYLLRESMTTAGNYALSICHQGRIHHYSIERQPDGMVMIQEGKKFKGPVELVQHHEKNLDGFLTKPLIACERLPDQPPMAWPHVTMHELELALLEKADSMGLTGVQLENALGPQRQKFVNMVARELHREQCWFHGKLPRDEADNLMNNEGHFDGKYLVRERDDKSFALSLSFRNQTKHYKIDRHPTGGGPNADKLAIEEGPRFDCLMDMIAHYHNKTDGLLCKLTRPSICQTWSKKVRTVGLMMERNKIYGFFNDQDTFNAQQNGPEPSERPVVRPRTSVSQPSGRKQGDLKNRLQDPTIQAHGIINSGLMDAPWDELDQDIPDEPPPLVPPRRSLLEDDTQKIYDSVPRTDNVFNLNHKDIELKDKLGAGQFGSVVKGVYKHKEAGRQSNIPVAIKTLKQEALPNAESAIITEAKSMAGLEHRNIVRLIGVCRAETIMLVMELAPFGQLNKYLKRHPNMAVRDVLSLMFQVAEGMAYLESKNFVHRDLAARNVLLVNESFAKISDFGMSKALGLGNAYYQAETAGKWPLKWYAPECIYYFKFDSKSDVWSYGVTLWEGLSFGAKPYKGLKGQMILELIESGKRLEQPDKCPRGVYEIMTKCWQYEKKDRPTFKEIVEMLRKHR